MAGYRTGNTGENPGDKPPPPNRSLSFRDLMALIYGGNVDDCGFPLPYQQGNGSEWLEKFMKAKDCAVPTGPKDVLTTGAPIPGISISHNSVMANFTEGNSQEIYKQNLILALGMAVCAMGNKQMREQGVEIVANSPTEAIFLTIAASYLGLPLKNPNPQIVEKLEEYRQQIGADDIWEEFAQIMRDTPKTTPILPDGTEFDDIGKDNDTAPDENDNREQKAPKQETLHDIPPSPLSEAERKAIEQLIETQNKTDRVLHDIHRTLEGTVSEAPVSPETANKDDAINPDTEDDKSLHCVFNREISGDAAPFLKAEGIDEQTYRKVSEAIIKEQNAKKGTLDKLRRDFNLTGSQMRGIVKAMDEEGLTVCKPGKPRTVNYDAEGQPKAP
ncbi:MAG: hypothetical protein H6867_08975 [Rhodospirillales bacterium]|nr:hypothetical protein [Rhodospirillales bacterium]MCB9996062.1 hypothetical protein [Rhodospirillales bacterium]